MRRRQTRAREWLIIDTRTGDYRLPMRSLRRGDGLLLLFDALASGKRARLVRKLRILARARGLALVHAPGTIVRAHDHRELRDALLSRAPVILLSPLYPTRSHPGQAPIPRLRAAALARLGGGQLIALGGMNRRRYAQIKRLGFSGWAGIDAFRT